MSPQTKVPWHANMSAYGLLQAQLWELALHLSLLEWVLHLDCLCVSKEFSHPPQIWVLEWMVFA